VLVGRVGLLKDFGGKMGKPLDKKEIKVYIRGIFISKETMGRR
jgi:hypothetical protein